MYGEWGSSPRRLGVLNFPISAHFPVVIAAPGSEVVTRSPVTVLGRV